MRIFGMLACPLLLAASMCGLQSQVQSKGQTTKGVKDFVQGFYDWYVPKALKAQTEPALNVALRHKNGVFSAALFRALKEDAEAQAKANGEIVGLDFDPFLNTQDPCDRYEVGTVSSERAEYLIDIYGVCGGKRNEKPDVVAKLMRQGGSWAFTNFLYPAIHSDLVSTLRTLRKERAGNRD